jgi:hypothetical protein
MELCFKNVDPRILLCEYIGFAFGVRPNDLWASNLEQTSQHSPCLICGRTRGTATPDYRQTSTHHNSVNMSAVDIAFEDLESREFVDESMYGEVAAKYGCSRSAVSRRWRGVSRSKTTSDGERRNIQPQQELELVQYFINLHKNGLAPTREMIQNSGSEVAGKQVSLSWVDRFLHSNHNELILRWTPSIDCVR